MGGHGQNKGPRVTATGIVADAHGRQIAELLVVIVLDRAAKLNGRLLDNAQIGERLVEVGVGERRARKEADAHEVVGPKVCNLLTNRAPGGRRLGHQDHRLVDALTMAFDKQ